MCDAGPLSSIAWANFLASGWFVQLAHSCYLSISAKGLDNHLFMPFLTHWGQVTLKCISNLCPLLLSFLLLFFPLAHCYFLSCHFIHTATQMNCYFLSCYFFSYLPTVTFFPVTLFILLPKWTVTFFPVTFFPTCPLLLSFLLLYSYCYPNELLLSFLLLFFLLAHCYFLSCYSTHTATPKNCYFLSCYYFSYLPTVTFFPVTFFPTCQVLLSLLLLFFLLLFFLPETVTFFPVTFFPVTFFPCTGSYSGSNGSLGTQNACNDIDLPVVHAVAPVAHWGHRTDKMMRLRLRLRQVLFNRKRYRYNIRFT